MEEFVNNIYRLQTWDKAIKKSFLTSKKIYHLNIKTPCEDGVWNYQLFCNFPNTYFTDKQFYKYRIRENSIIHKLSKEKNECLIRTSCVANDLESCKDKHYSEESKKLYLSKIIFYCLLKCGYRKTKKKINWINKKYCNDLWNNASKTSLKIRLLIKFKHKWITPLILNLIDKKNN